jgi:ABC-type nitrate/sulfonate/bicarbonate transport system ATPase subunit/flavin-dependent dehydrogenase
MTYSIASGRGQNNAAGSSGQGGEASSLRLRDVSKVFQSADGGSVLAVDRVSLSVAAGEMVSLIGQSGCGKSTVLRMIAGLDQPTSGEVRVGNEVITHPSADRGLMFQNHNLFPWLTVRRNIQSGLVARGILRERRSEVDEIMRLVGLEAFANVYPHQLSGGMAQRVALARALINHPRVLLLDEPLGALDQLTRMQMQDEILALWQARGTTMVLVTHYIDEAIYMSDRVVIMTPRPGRIERIMDVPLPRPRERNSREFQDLRAEMIEALHLAESGGISAHLDRERGCIVLDEPPHHAEIKEMEAASPSAAAQLASTDISATERAKNATNGSSLDAEVIIIGGGPAGSTLGAYLAKAGIDHLILDKAVHPRRHVGESLVCSTTRLFEEIDFLPVMEREGFVRKYGANWVHWADGDQCTLRFREIPELGISQDYTYHVDRGRFDQLLLEHVEARGSRVLQGAHVERVEFGQNGEVIGVHVQHAGASRLLRCRLVADASGRNTILGTQLKLKKKDPFFNQFAVHGWYKHVDRGDAASAGYIHIYLLPMPRAWAWQIPITETITSVGVVTEGHDFVKAGESVEDYFARLVTLNPVLAERMAAAHRVQDFCREGNYSYVMDKIAGDGWVLVGDAARFVDPIFSSGVSVAMESAKRAADAIRAALASGDLSAASFADYERTIRGGCDVWREFILLFYRLPPLFFTLLKQPEVRLAALRLLQGQVYDRCSDPVLERMRREIQAVEETPGHPWTPYLSPEMVETV